MEYISFDCRKTEEHLKIIDREAQILNSLRDIIHKMLFSDNCEMNEEQIIFFEQRLELLLQVNYHKKKLLLDAIEDFYTASRHTMDKFYVLDAELKSDWKGEDI